MKDIRNYGLLAHNTFGIDVTSSRFLEYESVEEARQIVGLLTEAVSATAHFRAVVESLANR